MRIGGKLSPVELERYERDGILFPVPAITPAEAAYYRARFEDLEGRMGGCQRNVPFAHLCFDWAYELATRIEVVDAVESLLGSDILIDDTAFFCKNPGDTAFAPWHQDGTYSGWYTTPSVSVWLALTDSTPENGCMRAVPGSHLHGRHAHHELDLQDALFKRSAEIETEVDESQVRDIELSAGEFSMHHSSIVHGSKPYRSGGRRIGFVIRFVTPAFQHRRNPRAAVRARHAADCGAIPVLAEAPSGDPSQGYARLCDLARANVR
jgi:non-heme Fe2+,alpha-ketoglutarate-dependent halogenase